MNLPIITGHQGSKVATLGAKSAPICGNFRESPELVQIGSELDHFMFAVVRELLHPRHHSNTATSKFFRWCAKNRTAFRLIPYVAPSLAIVVR